MLMESKFKLNESDPRSKYMNNIRLDLYAWISTYFVYRICDKDNVRIFSLSRGAWGF